MHVNESSENYLETILMLSKKLPVVRAVDIATELNFKKSSVSVAMKKLRESEHIIVSREGYILSLIHISYTLEEVVSRDYVLNENPDVIVDLVDATNIERNLYLTKPLVETGVPVVIALNMCDLLAKRGIKIDVKRLSMLIGCPIVEISALKQKGLDELIDEAIKVAKQKEVKLPGEIFAKDIDCLLYTSRYSINATSR